MYDPWYKLDAYSDKLPAAVVRSLNIGGNFRRRRLLEDYALEWAYQRERYWSSIPAQVQAAMPWIVDRQESGPPSPNIIRMAVDTVISWLFTEIPPLTVGSSGASYEELRQVEARSLALDATINGPARSAKNILAAARDGVLKGFGVLWPRSGNDIRIQRLHRKSVFYDPHDARDGDPNHVQIIERYDRDHWLAWYRGLRDIQGHRGRVAKIERLPKTRPIAGGTPDAGWSPYDFELAAASAGADSFELTVVHTYRRSSGPGQEDGRYVCTVHTGTAHDGDIPASGQAVVAIDQVFSRPTLPVALWSAYPGIEGIDGMGLGHLLQPWQAALDRSFFKIQRALDKYGHIKIFVPPDADKAVESFVHPGVTVVPVEDGGKAPGIVQQQVISSDEIVWIDRLLNWSTSIYGVNQMLATGTSQLGAGASGIAQVEENFRSLNRLSDVATHFAHMYEHLGGETLSAIEDAIKLNPEFEATYKDRNGEMLRRRWSELVATNASYDVKIEERGPLASRRAGRVAQLLDMAQRQLLDPAIAKEALLGNPDVRRAARLELAPQRLVEWQIDQLRRPDGDHEAAMPDRDTPLSLAIDMVTREIQIARTTGAMPETISRLREYKLAAQQLLATSSQSADGQDAAPATPSLEELAALASAAPAQTEVP